MDGYTGSNIEDEEVFKVYFPDSHMDSTRGGQSSATEFIRQALEATKNKENNTQTEIEINANLSNERVQDYEDSNLMGACILQYPYGRGGIRSDQWYILNTKNILNIYQRYPKVIFIHRYSV